MQLHNTLTRKIENFTPHKPHTATVYACGPTVYDYAHIGNLRKFIFDDTLHRTLRAAGFSVQQVMNVTDVGHLTSDGDEGEDKSEKGAKREGKTVREVADTYTEAFKADVAALNILAPSVNPERSRNRTYHDAYARATDFIPEQQDMVARLLAKGFAYITRQAIYFDVAKLPDYGVLTGQRLTDKEVGARDEVITDPEKRNPQDFAVWFFTVDRFADHSMHWASPWGDGFPGWHLECSAIIHTLLGDPIDIHTGGIDHIGTHHPNEMAQTEGAFGHNLATYWLHSNFILVDGAKMAKSKGNFYTLADITKRGFSPLAYRLLVLQAHYRSELNFTWDSLEAAQARLKTLQSMADLRWQLQQITDLKKNDYQSTAALVLHSMQTDLNTPKALSLLGELTDNTSAVAAEDSTNFIALLQVIDNLFGLQLLSSKDITDIQKQTIRAREQARQTHDWAQGDKLRNELEEQGIGLRDTPNGALWFRL